ncbi:zinc-dependent alcohol dehydrogenase family protein [Salinimonas sp. HHU 13199]|uniref:Zinc-dependent alcohol dehydrogenase family protein n=1 Tax=Salinimonas profundi TaxID=2729140 RepID=A0ABR8LGR2_9ALTE|nr:zinc-dependent alcohol dehydrogenase family protein [Salinimonas profundi]MBD3584902.1 zinc-dependent alcohol dehydrogenase family protein [Salinimonas profundi]
MKAVVFEKFGESPKLMQVNDPAPHPDGVVIKVKATGVCRSDWHAWMGHDPDIVLPHVPGHEFAGIVEATGKNVRGFKVGDRVTSPFISACGRCSDCASGNQQVCSNQTQPGFTHWGSFAEFVAIDHADANLIALPEEMAYSTAASLGCRFATSFHAVVDQGAVSAGQWVAVHGCGGVGLSAIMIAAALGARVIAIDLSDEALKLADKFGAAATINANQVEDVVEAILELTKGGAHVSLDALGHPVTAVNSVKSLRRLGRHIQVGLLLADQSTPPIPMDKVVANELMILGSHGMQAHRYDAMLNMILSGTLAPEKLLGRSISLEESISALTSMDQTSSPGVTVVTQF